MLKAMRNRLLILNMTIISLLLIVSFSSIYSTTYINIESENKNMLHDSNYSQAFTPVTAGEFIVGEVYLTITMDSKRIRLVLDSEQNVISHESVVEYPDKFYEEISQLALDKNGGKFNFADRQWMCEVLGISSTSTTSSADGEYIIYIKEEASEILLLDITDSQKLLSDLLITFIVIGIISLLIIFLISLFFANRSIRPIAVAWDKQKQFIADASHELKTPITIIDANVEALLVNSQETVESQMKWIDYIKAENERMSKLVSNLLFLAKHDDNGLRIELKTINLTEILTDILLRMEAPLFEKGLKLEREIPDGIMAKADEDKVKQVLLILLDNALKYSEPGGLIRVSVKQTTNNNHITVYNTGKGIDKKDFNRIFDRFYRADESRAHDGGYGLGLSIASVCVKSMGGQIHVESELNQYAAFTFTLLRN